MRRILLFGLLISLGGCEGYNTWWNPPFTTGYNPNMPRGDSINLRRVMGTTVAVDRLTPEPGDIWPGPVPEMPTLQDIERDSGIGERISAPSFGGTTGGGVTGASPSLPNLSPPARDPASRIVNTPGAPSVTSGGTTGYQTTTTPQGSAIIVPNGNGTSTIIHPDGRIETIPTPR
jgi:hypothetical protein